MPTASFDPHVERTANRPLAQREIAPWEALVVAAVLALCAFLLILRLNTYVDPAVVAGAGDRGRLSVLQALFRAAAGVPRHRVFVRHSDGVRRGRRDGPARSAGDYFAANLFWVMAYDTEYAMVDRDDDVKLGMKTSAIFFGKYDVLDRHALLRDPSRRD